MQDSSNQIQRLERKVDFLTWVVSVQALLIGIVAIGELMKFAAWIILFAVVLVPILYIFRASLPHWARRLGVLFGKAERVVREKLNRWQSSSMR